MSKTVKIGIVAAISLISYIFFVLYLLPLNDIFGHFLAEVPKYSKGSLRVEVSEINPSLLFDNELKDFVLYKKTRNDEQVVLKAKRLYLGFSLFSLLMGNYSFRYQVDFAKDGSSNLSGYVDLELNGNQMSPVELDMELNSIPIEAFPYLFESLNNNDTLMNLAGSVSGNINIGFGSRFVNTESEFNFSIKDLHFTDFKIKGFRLPALQLSDKKIPAVIEGKLNRGKLSFRNFNFPGEDLELKLKGWLKFNNSYDITNSDIKGQFSIADAVFEKLPKEAEAIKGMKNSDGFYSVSVSGSFKKPSKPEVKIGELNLTPFLGM